MKTFVAALVILVLLTVATVINAYVSEGAVSDIEQAVKLVGDDTTQTNAIRINRCIELVEDKRETLHLTLRHTHIDALATNLQEAHAYCINGDAPSMNASVQAALFKLDRFKKIERFSLYNIL